MSYPAASTALFVKEGTGRRFALTNVAGGAAGILPKCLPLESPTSSAANKVCEVDISTAA
jgi:hypothetical protein